MKGTANYQLQTTHYLRKDPVFVVHARRQDIIEA
jgi:hypothetical protein